MKRFYNIYIFWIFTVSMLYFGTGVFYFVLRDLHQKTKANGLG